PSHMVRCGPSAALSAASRYLAALLSYFSTLAWKSMSMTPLPTQTQLTRGDCHLRPPEKMARVGKECSGVRRDLGVNTWAPTLGRLDLGANAWVPGPWRLALSREPVRRFGGALGLVPQATPRRLDLGIRRAVTARIGLRGPHRVLRHIEPNRTAGQPLDRSGSCG